MAGADWEDAPAPQWEDAPSSNPMDVSPDDSPEAMEAKGQAGAGEALLHYASGIPAALGGGLTYLGTLAATGGDTKAAAAVKEDTENALTFEPRTQQGKGTVGVINKAIAPVAGYVQRKADEVGEKTAEGQGPIPIKSPLLGAIERTGLSAIAMLAGGGAGRGLVRDAEMASESAVKSAAETAAPPKATPGPVTPEQLQASPKRLPDPPTKAAPGAPEAPLTQTPAKPKIVAKAGESAQQAAERQGVSPAPKFVSPEQEGTAHGPLPAEEQAARKQSLQDLNDASGGALPEHRVSAVTGDYSETGADHQYAKGEDEGGKKIKATIAQENTALKTASEQASSPAVTGDKAVGTTTSAIAERGTVIDRALQNVGDWFDNAIKGQYRAADAAAKGQPMQKFDSLQGMLEDHSQFTGIEGRQLHSDVQMVAKQFGMMGEDGFWKPTTVETAERFRQWLGEQGANPRLSRVVGKLKDAVDNDVAAHGGQGLYDEGRRLRYQRDQMLEGPNGIRKLASVDKYGNRGTEVDKIPDALLNMGQGQFEHVINVLHDSSKLGNGELAAGNAAAINAIRGHMAARLHEAGASARDLKWDPHGYYNALDKYSLKMPKVFGQASIDRFHTINRAGNALRMDKSYPGAGAQIQKLGGLAAIARDRIAHIAEGAVTGTLGPLGGAAVEAIGGGAAIRKGVNRVLGGGAETAREKALKERVQPLGQRIPRQGGWIGNKPEPKDFENAEHVVQETPHEHFVNDDGDHVFTTGNGASHIIAEPRENGNLRIRGSFTTKDERGQGHGGVLYQKAAEHATGNGGRLESDAIVSKDAQKRWAELSRNGWDVKRDPNAKVTETGGLINEGDNPVFTTAGRREPLGARIGGGKQRGAVGDLGKKKPKPQEEGYQAPKELTKFIRKQAPAHVVDEKGPASWEDLQARGHESPLPVNPQEAHGSIYGDVPTNIAFRAWHDKTHLDLNAGFDHEGELRVALEHQRQAKEAGLSEESRRALWADTWETFKHHEDTGAFPGKPREFVAEQMKKKFPGEEDMHSTVNIGLHVGDPANGGHVMQPGVATAALRKAGAKIVKKSVSTAGSEPTLVASLDKPLTREQMQGVLADTGQSAIPQRFSNGAGEMHVAPGHEARAAQGGWDKYNGDEFRMHDDRTATEHGGEREAYAAIKEHLTPKEQQSIETRGERNRSKAISNLLDTFHGSTSVEGTAAMALAGQAKKGWYRKAAQAINTVFGPDAPRFTALLAAMSPQTSVEMNFHNALRTFVNWDKAGRPQDAAAIKKVMEDSSLKNEESESESNVMDAWHQNAVRALTSADPEHEMFQLSGPKVDSFHKNLRGHMNEVTNDSWNAIAMNISQKLFSGAYKDVANDVFGRMGFKSPAYMGVSAKVRAAAAHISKLTGEKWTPAEVQETMWSFVKTAFEHAKATGKSIPELIKSGELNDELIRGTSDFHTLFGDPEHRSFLAGSKFSEAAERVAGGKNEGPIPARTSKARSAAAETVRPALLSEAGRLEGARQARLADRKARIGNIKVPF